MKILVVNVNWLGDVLFSTPALRALRKQHPKDTIACLVPSRCVDVLRNNPYLDEVIVADDRDTLLSFFASLKTILLLRRKRFDAVFFLHRSISKRLLTFLAGIPVRKGFETRGRSNFLLTHTAPALPADIHRTDFFLRVLSAHGIASGTRTPDFFPSKEAVKELETLCAEAGLDVASNYVVVHPGGNWDLKRWPAGYFAEWIRLFLDKNPSRKVVLCGTPPENYLAEEIRKSVRSERLVSLCGKTSLDALALLIQKARFLLSNDSGPIHLAASQKTPIVGLYGPTSARRTGPLSEGPVLILSKDVGCQVPCYFRGCDARVCLDWITPNEVFEKTEVWMDQNEPTR